MSLSLSAYRSSAPRWAWTSTVAVLVLAAALAIAGPARADTNAYNCTMHVVTPWKGMSNGKMMVFYSGHIGCGYHADKITLWTVPAWGAAGGTTVTEQGSIEDKIWCYNCNYEQTHYGYEQPYRGYMKYCTVLYAYLTDTVYGYLQQQVHAKACATF
jgi:hypothetical protein